ncbi:pyruvate dehydrogenase (acetyl-transferring) E1 component subunit alpha [Candidatus Nanohalococcus occultus]|uniref:pyruvate dehydrogenase (acetyl-transferring) E1 component subunit alpha n=1 Tax=Candidatus Nanohalococcus occultus TaxID=2978047 RepID=UPI0039E07783
MMAANQVYEGAIKRIEVMAQDEESSLEKDQLHEIYRQMILARKFDEKAFKLQRRGEVSTYAPHKGQEASQIGAVFAMNDDDWMVPSFRETAAYMARGAPLEKLFQRWMGDARGQKELENDLPVAIPVGTQNLHAVGIGMAMSFDEEEKAVVGFTGDGSTSEGDFHEALNFSGVFDAHSVIVVQNNQYAISMPVEKQTNAETIAQKALAYGIEGIQVDGNDVLAVIEAMNEALEKARNGEPVLLEAVTYRLEDHTTSDDSTRYRDDEEVEEWKEHDPILRLKEYLKENDQWDDSLEEYEEKAEEKINEAANKAMEVEDPEMEEMFEYVYKEMPDLLKRDKKDLEEVEK